MMIWRDAVLWYRAWQSVLNRFNTFPVTLIFCSYFHLLFLSAVFIILSSSLIKFLLISSCGQWQYLINSNEITLLFLHHFKHLLVQTSYTDHHLLLFPVIFISIKSLLLETFFYFHLKKKFSFCLNSQIKFKEYFIFKFNIYPLPQWQNINLFFSNFVS